MSVPSEWRSMERYVLNQKVYQVYRLRDKDKPMTPSNMQIVSNWDTRADAEAAAKRKNIITAEGED